MQQLLLSIIQRTQRIRRMQTVLCQETFDLWWILWNKLKIILITVNIEDVWLTGQTVIMYSITGCSRWLSPIRILATGSLCLPLSLSLSVSATGNRDKSRIWLVHTQLINHYRTYKKMAQIYRFTQKITKTTKKTDNPPAPRTETCRTPRCDSRRQAIHQFVQRQLRLLPLLVKSPS